MKFVSLENLLQATGKRIVLKPAAFTELINCWVINGFPQFVSPPIASNELPTFQPIPIRLVNSTLVRPPELTELTELEERELALEELLQLGGPYNAQYSGLHVVHGQSGQLFPCGQYSDDDEAEELDGARLLELKLIEELDTGQDAPPTTPYGDGCEIHVAVEIQLLLFS